MLHSTRRGHMSSGFHPGEAGRHTRTEAEFRHVAGTERLEVRNPGWEVFVLLLSLLSLANIVLLLLPMSGSATDVVLIIDIPLCIVFIADFVYRYRAADSKRGYMLRGGGWLDLIGSLPFPGLRIARIYRVIKAAIAIRRHGGRGLLHDFLTERAQSAMYVVLVLVAVVLEFASIQVLRAESASPDANIQTASDALWWGYVTITTVGYGDQFPVTDQGRVVGVVLLTIGVGLFGTFTAFVANVFLSPKRLKGEWSEDSAQLRYLAEEHERAAARLRRTLDETEAGA